MSKKVMQYSHLPKVEISVNKNIVKIYNDKNIFLDGGTEFELYFNNPNNSYYKVEIFFNNKKQKTDLVLTPNTSTYLDRFMDEAKKLKVDVFNVDDVQETKHQRENNGSIKIRFYKQIFIPVIDPIYIYSTYPAHSSLYSYPKWSNDATIMNTHDTNISYNSTTTTYASIGNSMPTIESARINTGSKSSQNLQEISLSFEINPVIEFEYKILPISQKPADEESALSYIVNMRNYCPICGRRYKKGWLYCAGCGTKL